MKLFVFDIDATLVDIDYIVSEANIKAINERLAKGDIIAIASGRPYLGVKYFLDKFGPGKKFIIAANGAATYDYDGKVLDIEPMKYLDFVNLEKKYEFLIKKYDASLYCYTLKEVGYFVFTENTRLESTCNDNCPLRDFNKFPMKDDEPLLKMMIAAHASDLENVDFTEIDEKYHHVDSSEYYHEFVNKNADKARGVEVLRKLFNLNPLDCYTFGDEMNDYLMIKSFNGVAMGNAIKKVKEVAHYVTKDIKHDGVAYAINNYIKD
jgi:Cof subfamily protein (haloacid dehalogenase superfamily)